MNRMNKISVLLLSLILILSVNTEQSLDHELKVIKQQFGLSLQNNQVERQGQSFSQTQGTQGFYFSPHALGKQPQVYQALKQIQSVIKISKTTYKSHENTYIMDNFQLDLQYNDGKQTIFITDDQKVQVINGTVFLGYRFNFTITGPGKNVNGTGFGSIYSDALQYKKQLGLNNAGILQWQLTKGGYKNLAMNNNRMKIKRIQPFDQKDLQTLQQMMDRAFQNIQPSNIQHQFLDAFNIQFPKALNKSINHEVFSRKIQYSYHDTSKGQLNLTFSRQMWNFGVNKDQGYKMIFVTQIQGHQKQTTCNISVPYQHADWNIYGGLQTIHLNCLYQDVVNYIQTQGWLDTHLNSNWQVNAFQFYAGDLFDIMNGLYLKVNPRSILQGQCKADNKNLVFRTSPQVSTNQYLLKVNYDCSIKTTSKTAEALDILKFTAQTNFYIKIYADKLSLNFEITDATVKSLSFTPVNNFFVTNLNLAFFKAEQVLKKNIGQKVFGTGFPTIPMQFPKTSLDREKVMFYDAAAHQSIKPQIKEIII